MKHWKVKDLEEKRKFLNYMVAFLFGIAIITENPWFIIFIIVLVVASLRIKEYSAKIEELQDELENAAMNVFGDWRNRSGIITRVRPMEEIYSDLTPLEKTSFSEIIGVPYGVREFFSTARKWKWKKILINGGVLVMAVCCILLFVSLAFYSIAGARVAGKIFALAIIAVVATLLATRKNREGKNNDQELQ